MTSRRPRTTGALRAALLAFALLGLASAAQAQRCPHTPAVGSAERKAIMDTLRGPVEMELNQSVRFVAKHFAVCDGWAFLEAQPEQFNGKPIDWKVSKYAADLDVCGGYVHALLAHEGGLWVVRELVVCASDVPWVTWAQDFGAPAAIFPRLN